VDAHPNANRARRECALPIRCGGDRILRSVECDEECIALRVDLNTSMADKCVTQRAPMLGEDPA
jgi:hypothetical protein